MTATSQKARRGIILAGGAGSRLHPLTQCVSKQLLPVYDKPMIYYPLATLMTAGIRDILIISTPRDLPLFQNLFRDGSQYGISISYAEQPSPDGLAQAFLIGEDFLNDHPAALVLGDNIFFDLNASGKLESVLKKLTNQQQGAGVCAYPVSDPERYGVISTDNTGKVLDIEEKPKHPKSNFAVSGLYFYDNTVVQMAKSLKPSKRGELEITDLNNLYLANGTLTVEFLDQNTAWLDAGTHSSLLEAANLVKSTEAKLQHKIACLEEIALRKGFIDKAGLRHWAEGFKNNEYGNYLSGLIK